jgi:phage terminase small subunit
MLAGHISTYIECEKGIKVTGIITKYNNGKTLGPSPFVSLRDKVTPRIIALMNELGLTPRSRLQGNPSDDIEISELMAGPDRYK